MTLAFPAAADRRFRTRDTKARFFRISSAWLVILHPRQYHHSSLGTLAPPSAI
ncbi:hypothetical protein HU200_039280 [Digitaria exilis]|uniref:Uncharacterized protein n=1 Tax=Digitaria exilis TaxID=1010633 RepID=A0A835B8Q2_9POAL|nr:hypothetical protein HU200_039280 [Digitaria exilis]